MPGPLELTFAVLRGEPGPATTALGILALSEPDAEIQSRAVALLLERGGPAGFDALRAAFPALQGRSREALRSAGEAFVRHLGDTLRSDPPEARAVTVDLLADLGRGEALQVLVGALADPEEPLRSRAAAALTALAREAPSSASSPTRRKEMIEALLTAVRNYRQHMRPEMLEALLKLDPVSHKLLLDILSNPGDPRRDDLRGLLDRSLDAEILHFLLKMLRDPRDRLRDDAARILEQRSPDRAFQEALAQAFDSPAFRSGSRLAAELETLPWWPPDPAAASTPFLHHLVGFLREARRIPPPQRLSRIAALLAVPDAGVRAQAALLLTEIKDPAAEEALWTVLDDPDEAVQSMAVRALAASQHPHRRRILTAKLNHPFISVRDSAREAVAREGFSHYLSTYQKMDDRTRSVAGQALAKLDPDLNRRIQAELSSLDPARKLRALQVLETVDRGKDLAPMLVGLMRDPDRKVRASVVRSLAVVGSLETMRALVKGLTDPDRRVRANAIEALGQVGDSRMGRLLLPFLKDPDNRCRGNAVAALWSMGHAEAADHAARMLDSPEELMRLSGVWALEKIGGEATGAALARAAASDPSPRVRERAQKALARGRA